MKKKQQLADRRLLGTWRSDKRKTTQFWAFREHLTPEKRKRFFRILGKLKFRFTPTRIHSEFADLKKVTPYSVIAKDEKSVLIERHEKQGTSLQQIFFEGGSSFYVVSGYNVEFFKRVR